MRKVASVQTKPEYVLVLEFDDGVQGEISIEDRLFGPMFEPLKDPAFFVQVSVDAFGAICWPNEADLAPDVLYQTVVEG